jgi:hypothetical protein
MLLSMPIDYPTGVCILVPIDVSLVPIVAGQLLSLQESRKWVKTDYEAAYRAFAEVGAYMTALCAQDIIESNNRIYRLLDTALFGRVYSVITTEPLVISPDIPLVPDNSIISPPSLLSVTETTVEVLINSLRGEDTPQFTGEGVYQLLQAIIDAVQAQGGLDDDMLAKLEQIALLLA